MLNIDDIIHAFKMYWSNDMTTFPSNLQNFLKIPGLRSMQDCLHRQALLGCMAPGSGFRWVASNYFEDQSQNSLGSLRLSCCLPVAGAGVGAGLVTVPEELDFHLWHCHHHLSQVLESQQRERQQETASFNNWFQLCIRCRHIWKDCITLYLRLVIVAPSLNN